MNPCRSWPRRFALICALAACALRGAQAGTYLVCYLPPDTQQHLIRFCPGASDAAAGQPCQCLLQNETLSGTMTRITLADPGSSDAATRTMCLPQAQTGTAVMLCSAFRSEGDAGCACDGGGGTGEQYTVSMMPRMPLRTNQAAAADFLKRLQECCVSK